MPKELTREEVQSFRQRLCQAFEKRFAEQGYDAVTMRGLAEDVGCSPMTPYRYFEDKDEIFAAARAAGFRRLSDRIESAVAASEDPVERILAACRAYLEFAVAEPDAYRLMYTSLQPAPTDYPELEEEIARSRRIITELAGAVPQVDASPIRPAAAAHAFWAALHGVIQIHLANGFGESVDFEDVVSILMQVLVAGGRAVFGIPPEGVETPPTP